MKTSTHDAASQPNDHPQRQTARLDAQPQNRSEIEAQVHELIRALGEPGHPMHGRAVDDLVDIGAPAVPALSAALAPTYPWLTSFRAAEALAQIGDGRASGALINALRHPNSNVRWSAVRALAEIGDSRTLLALRRVAREDRSKTSWGESVADTAQVALNRLQSESALLRFSEPVKTALIFIVMIAVLVFAANRFDTLRNIIQDPASLAALNEEAVADGADDASAEDAAGETGGEAAGAAQEGEGQAGAPEPTAEPTPQPSPTAEPTPQPVLGTARVSGNIRSGPGLDAQIIGGVNPGDELYFLEQRGDWYRIRLGPNAPGASLNGDEGWVANVVVNPPPGPVPQGQ